MKWVLCKREDERLRRKAFEAYARSCACAESGDEFYEEGKRYARLAVELVSALEHPEKEDEALLLSLAELFN